jgi:hypothetical protein
MLSFFLIVIITLLPFSVAAHPGHGTFDGLTPLHYISSPIHLIAVMAVISLAILGIQFLRKKIRKII